MNKEKMVAIKDISNQKIEDCMQCTKCSAGCPAKSGMDILPHQVIRYLQLNKVEKLENSKTIWACASCFTCGARCPRNIDISKLMEAIRLTIIRQKDQNRLIANDIVLDSEMPQQAIVSGFRKLSK